MLTHFSLFSGIGGIDLAAEWAGFTTVGQCEWADYPTKVLEKHWPDVPRWRDIRDVTAQSFYRKTGLRTVELISGGFPCQPFSIAGKRKGKEDDRDLWPEMFRVIQELKPRWVLGENVANFVNMELERTILDLEDEGYETQAFLIPACAIGAPHRRDRVWIVANTGRKLQQGGELKKTLEIEVKKQYANKPKRPSSSPGHVFPDTYCEGQQTRGCKEPTGRKIFGGYSIGGWWEFEPGMGRVANGISNRVDRLRALGNAVVPQQVYPILKAIAEIETIA